MSQKSHASCGSKLPQFGFKSVSLTVLLILKYVGGKVVTFNFLLLSWGKDFSCFVAS